MLWLGLSASTIGPTFIFDQGFEGLVSDMLNCEQSDKYLEYPIYLAYTVAILEKAGIDVHFIDAVEINF